MRQHCSVYVDVGYLLASAATRATGTSLRGGVAVDYPKLVRGIIEQAEAESGLPVLRVHWYDSARDGIPDHEQCRIGELPYVKLRLGRFGVDGQQKGVDLRIGLDLTSHARNRTADVFFLLSGDDDLTEAVEEAQHHGVAVNLLAVPGKEGRPHGVARHLVRAADRLASVSTDLLDEFVRPIEKHAEPEHPVRAPAAPPAAPNLKVPTPAQVASRRTPGVLTATPPRSSLAYSGSTGGPAILAPEYENIEEQTQTIDGVVETVLKSFLKTAPSAALLDLRHNRPSIPREIDRALLMDMSAAVGVYDLSDPIRHLLRERFWVVYDRD